MCRLFGMSGGDEPVQATFWLREAPDSLAQQSRREPDGTGLGLFTGDGKPEVFKQPLAAYEDQAFAREARSVTSRTFVAHVRYASTGGLTLKNTHPFEQRSRLFAHNGVIGDLGALERELGAEMSLVGGDTDSERYFALITREIERTGDVGEGIASAARWVAANLPVFAINCVLITDSELFALRYPDVHELHVLERAPGGPSGSRPPEPAGAPGSNPGRSGAPGQRPAARAPATTRVLSGARASRPAVVVATERMDEDAGWREMEPGELLHVDGSLNVP